MHILGISAHYHDSAAALIADGDIVAAAQEERFTRKKHDPSFPRHAIDYCLAEAGITLADVSYIAFYEKSLMKFDRLLETYLAYAPSGFRSFRAAMPVWLKDKLFMRSKLRGHLTASANLKGSRRVPIVFTEHHESHAASARHLLSYRTVVAGLIICESKRSSTVSKNSPRPTDTKTIGCRQKHLPSNVARPRRARRPSPRAQPSGRPSKSSSAVGRSVDSMRSKSKRANSLWS